MQTDTGTKLGVQEKVETGTGPEMAGKDRVALEKEGAAVEGADKCVAEGVGMGKVGPGGWGSGKELMEDMGAAGGSSAEGERDG